MNIEIKNSPLHGKGVFARTDFTPDQEIERCAIIKLSKREAKLMEHTLLNDYFFEWDQDTAAVVLGFGSLYNHSFEPNAVYRSDDESGEMVFVCIRPIQPGEEITVNYNGGPEVKEAVWFEQKSVSRYLID